MKNKTQANKGMAFEKEIEISNKYYDMQDMATVVKVPTAWKVLRGAGGKIKTAFPEKKSICDFLGIKDGQAIAFETKETNNKTSFPLSRIEPHQWAFLKKWYEHGGIVFVLIHFSAHGEFYKIPMHDLLEFELRMLNGGRKSIAHDELKPQWRIRFKNGVLNYL